MNRRHPGQGKQAQRDLQRGVRGTQFSGSSYDQDQEFEGVQAGPRSRNFSGNSSWSADDSSFENTRPSSSSSFRDTDYDLDGSTYGSQGRSPRSMDRNFGGRLGASEYGSSYGSTYGDYETNDRNRAPSRYSSLDDDRYSGDKHRYQSERMGASSSERSDRFNSDRFANDRFSSDRMGSSSERFGYPSNMNAWSGSDRSYNSGRTAGRIGQGTYGTQDYDLSNSQPYGASSYGEGSLGSDWGRESSTSQRGGFLGKGPKGYKRSDDRIKEDVCETLARDHRIDASDIEVTVEDAMVTLSGTVDTREAKRAAEMVIENLSGVDDVKNEIRVKKASDIGSDSSMHASSSTSNRSSLNSSSTSSKSTSGKGSGHI